jgi:hypothetical protein
LGNFWFSYAFLEENFFILNDFMVVEEFGAVFVASLRGRIKSAERIFSLD